MKIINHPSLLATSLPFFLSDVHNLQVRNVHMTYRQWNVEVYFI